jgi:hypothetical protein
MKIFSPNIYLQDKYYNIFNVKIQKPGLALIFILSIALALRVYICFFSQLPHIHRDSGDYIKQAEALLNRQYINYFPNGYPLIIAFIKFIAGNFTLTILLWLNVFMAVTTTFFTYKISKILFKNEGLALFAALLFAILPTQINISRWLISEVPTAFFLSGAYLLFLKRKYFWAGFFFAICSFIRTEMMMIFILFIVFDLLFLKKINLYFIVSFCIPLLIVAFYCKHKTGEFSLAGHGKVNIMLSITASGSNIDWSINDRHPEIKTKDGAMKKYLDHLKSEPREYIKQRAANFWELWGMPSTSEGNRNFIARLVMLIENIFMLLGAIIAWWINKKRVDVFRLIYPFAVVTIVHVLMVATPRYTIPVEPFMIILATWLVFWMIGKGRDKWSQYLNKEKNFHELSN